MAYKIIWLPKAEKRYDEIIEWLEKNWTDKEIANFVSRTDEVLELISIDPEIYRMSEKRNIRQAIITKHNLLLYRKKGNKIELLTFFDTRQKPSKKFK
ncbi:MAG: type II toxin-antitoxin system RelE/ParE family toxin [Chitinophagales bacterium]